MADEENKNHMIEEISVIRHKHEGQTGEQEVGGERGRRDSIGKGG